MGNIDRDRLDALLDLLADEVVERLEQRRGPRGAAPEPSPAIAAPPDPSPTTESTTAPASEPMPNRRDVNVETAAASETTAVRAAPEPELEREVAPDLAAVPPAHTASLLARLAFGVLLVVVLINIPLNAQGIALARSIPSSASLIIRNGLVVKEANSPDIWVYHDGAFHWITNLDAFKHFGYRWQDVHIVEDGYLKPLPKGKPLYVLLKCDASPHIYQLDQGSKRWIVDIPTFTAEGYVWQDVKMVPCAQLRSLPDGDSIPPGRGSPPPPLP